MSPRHQSPNPLPNIGVDRVGEFLIAGIADIELAGAGHLWLGSRSPDTNSDMSDATHSRQADCSTILRTRGLMGRRLEACLVSSSAVTRHAIRAAIQPGSDRL